jgi:tRNA A37 threonylcarbamoyladenosine synthetase subunit TsaC/SUA5/YrdC
LAQGIVNTAKQIVETSTTAKNVINNFKETVKIYEQGKAYYDALKSVNNLVKDARKVQKTVLLVGEISEIYVTSYQKIMEDENFTEAEIIAIGNGYAILLNESADLIAEVKEIITASSLSMSDAERMAIIEQVYTKVKKHRDFVSYYTKKNISISFIRAKKKNDTKRVLELYGNSDERYW